MTAAWGSSMFLPIKKPFSRFIPVNPEGLKPWSPHTPPTPPSFHMVGTTASLQGYANNPAKGLTDLFFVGYIKPDTRTLSEAAQVRTGDRTAQKP